MQHLEELYNSGKFEECLKQLEIFLLINPQNTAALFLKANCLRDYIYTKHEDSNPVTFSDIVPVLACYNSILALQPTHRNALLAYLEIGSYFIKEVNYADYMSIAETLRKDADPTFHERAVFYKSLLNDQQEHFGEALADIEELIELQKKAYQQDRERKDFEITGSIIRKTNIFRYKINQPGKALQVFNEYLPKMVSDTSLFFTDIALLGLEEKDYTLAGGAIEKALQTSFTNEDEKEELIDNIYPKIKEIIDNNNDSKELITAYLSMQRVFTNELNLTTTDIIFNAQYFINKYPTWFVPYHYAGAEFFDSEDHESALPYLEKAIQYGGYVFTVFRYIQSYYFVNGKIPSQLSWPTDDPRDYYNCGVDFLAFERSISTANLSLPLSKIRCKFYEIAFKGLNDYFNNDQYDSDCYTTRHLVAMCSNNYSIALIDIREYEKAIHVLNTGMLYSDFWEMHYNLADAYYRSNNFEKAIDIFDRVFDYKVEYSDVISYLKALSKRVICRYNLKEKELADQMFKELEKEYEQIIQDVDLDNLEGEDRFNWNQALLEIQNARHTLMQDLTSEEAIKKWQAELEKNPDDHANWYMLMQHYYQVNDYKNCIACADNYEAVKPVNELALVDYRKLHFMRGRSFLALNNNTAAIKNFNLLMDSYTGNLSETDYSALLNIHEGMAQAYFNTKEWNLCIDSVESGLKIFNDMKWYLDEAWLRCAILSADAHKMAGDNAKSIKILKEIIREYPDNIDARERLKNLKGNENSFFRFFKKK